MVSLLGIKSNKGTDRMAPSSQGQRANNSQLLQLANRARAGSQSSVVSSSSSASASTSGTASTTSSASSTSTTTSLSSFRLLPTRNRNRDRNGTTQASSSSSSRMQNQHQISNLAWYARSGGGGDISNSISYQPASSRSNVISQLAARMSGSAQESTRNRFTVEDTILVQEISPEDPPPAYTDPFVPLPRYRE